MAAFWTRSYQRAGAAFSSSDENCAGSRERHGPARPDQNIKWLQDFTSDDNQIRSALENLKASLSSEARMIDAIAEQLCA